MVASLCTSRGRRGVLGVRRAWHPDFWLWKQGASDALRMSIQINTGTRDQELEHVSVLTRAPGRSPWKRGASTSPRMLIGIWFHPDIDSLIESVAVVRVKNCNTSLKCACVCVCARVCTFVCACASAACGCNVMWPRTQIPSTGPCSFLCCPILSFTTGPHATPLGEGVIHHLLAGGCVCRGEMVMIPNLGENQGKRRRCVEGKLFLCEVRGTAPAPLCHSLFGQRSATPEGRGHNSKF